MPDDARLDAEVLARHALGWDRARLIADGQEAMPPDVDRNYSGLIERRATHEPVAYITGHREFWGLEFVVSPDVLIPRPETEFIIEAVCELRRDRNAVRRIVDVGTGSGCLAVSLAHEFPAARVVATDVSIAALRVAAGNVRKHGVEQRVRLVCGDLLEAIGGGIDVIVANPPYVPANVALSLDIVRFEPAVALYSGVEGLDLVRRLVQSARSRLTADGVFAMEFGYGQDDAVRELALEAGWSAIETKDDLQGIPRVAVMRA